MLLRVMAALDLPWAAPLAMLARMNTIVDNHGLMTHEEIAAVASRFGPPLMNTERVEMRGSTAVIPVEGPIFKKANLLTQHSGATSVETLATDFQAALDNPGVDRILLNIDSEGGQVDSIMEFADLVREGSAQKPVTAYIGNLGASGAYWIASAASHVVMSRAAFAGSIGVVANIRDNREAQQKQGVRNWEIVSSVSPLKRPDVATDAGRAQIQALVDSLGHLFVEKVASFRGVTTSKVEEDFGRGAVLPAGEAASAGMADEISNFEPLVARLAASPSRAYITVKENIMEPTNPLPAPTPAPEPAAAAPAASPNPLVAAAPAPPPMSERQRIWSILRCEEAVGRETLANLLALKFDYSVEDCREIMAAAPHGTTISRFEATMTQTPNPRVGAGTGPEDTSPQAEAQKILAFVRKENRARAVGE